MKKGKGAIVTPEQVFTKQEEIIKYLGTTKPTFQKYREYLPIFGMDATPPKYASTSNILDFVLNNIRYYLKLPVDMTFREIVDAYGTKAFSPEIVYTPHAKSAKVIAFNNLKGGVAKTTTVANLAAILAALGQKVLMVDMDMQNQLSDHFQDENYAGKSILSIIKAYAEKNVVDKELLKQIIVSMPVGNGKTVDLIPSEWDLGRGLEIARRKVEKIEFLLWEILNELKSNYDFILIDTPPTHILALDLSFYASDEITFVVSPEKKSYTSFDYLLKEINKLIIDAREFNLDIHLGAVILNKYVNTRTAEAVAESISDICKTEGLQVYKIEQKEIFARADFDNKALIAHTERTEALATIYELIDYAISLIIEKRIS